MTGAIRAIMLRHGLLVALTAMVGGASGRWGPGGVAVGGAAMGLAVAAYGAALGVVLRRSSGALAMILLFAKFLAFLGLGWLVLGGSMRGPDPLGFAVGVTCFPIATVWGALSVRGIDGAL